MLHPNQITSCPHTFHKRIYENIIQYKEIHNIGYKILAFFLGVTGTYSFLFAIGYFIYGETSLAIGLVLLTTASALLLIKNWNKIN